MEQLKNLLPISEQEHLLHTQSKYKYIEALMYDTLGFVILTEQPNKIYLERWCDLEKTDGTIAQTYRYMRLDVTNVVSQFFRGEISLLNVIKSSEFVYITDDHFTQAFYKIASCDTPEDYLPSENSFYDSQHYEISEEEFNQWVANKNKSKE